uniref:Uncharacterized protein LOC104222877 n=1 Tax=Nicotiana sylvestris TaxID=4096 RepID=A0A1U7VXJ7_NICSY
MANDGEINVANTQANVIQDASGKSDRSKKRNVTNKSQEVPPEVVSNEGGYSAKAAPLTELLKKNKPWVWTEHCQKAFESLKTAVTEEPDLALPDFAKTFEVHTDASDFAIGGVLMQDKHPIAFESHKLNETERRYTPGKGNVVADALSLKAELAVITSARWDIREAIKEGMQHDPAARQLIELANKGKTRRFWIEDDLLLTT